MMCVGCVQILYTILKKELEHPWILVSEENLEPVLRGYLGMTVYIS